LNFSWSGSLSLSLEDSGGIVVITGVFLSIVSTGCLAGRPGSGIVLGVITVGIVVRRAFSFRILRLRIV